MPIRVLIADDQSLVRSGLTTFLSVYPDLQLVDEARNGEEAVQICNANPPDVILMDLMMPRMNGVEATRLIRAQHPTVQVIALTSFKEKELVQNVLQAGAIGYLLKDVTAEELAQAVRAAYAGRPTLSPEATQVLIEQTRHGGQPTVGHDLTERERAVLRLMVAGKRNPEIAELLFLSLSTVKFHVSSILGKLQVDNRMEAITLAMNQKLVAG
jgi:two-component system, NarL family, response regulator LiaR